MISTFIIAVLEFLCMFMGSQEGSECEIRRKGIIMKCVKRKGNNV
jgi:hypothetical protein